MVAKVLLKFDLEAIPGSMVTWEDLKTFLAVEKRPIVVSIKIRTVHVQDEVCGCNRGTG